MKLGIILASRGMMFSKTTESLYNNLKKLPKAVDHQLYMAHGLPIPTCFNYPLNKALQDGCDWIWFLEEDMEVPADTLVSMLAVDRPVVTVNYVDRRSGYQLINRCKDKVLFSGMGCLLVKAEVLNKIEPPWCRTGVFWKVEDEETGEWDWEYKPEIVFKEYGSQDVYLCMAIRKAGYEIFELPNAGIGHMKLLSKAEDIKNNGGDEIEVMYLKDNLPMSFPVNETTTK